MTLASLKEAQALVALEVGGDAVVSAAGTGWRATDSFPGDKLSAWGGSGLTPCGRIRGAGVDSGHFVGFHGSGGRSGRSGWPQGPSPDQPSCPREATPQGVSTAPICGLSFHPPPQLSPSFSPMPSLGTLLPRRLAFFPGSPLLLPFLCVL